MPFLLVRSPIPLLAEYVIAAYIIVIVTKQRQDGSKMIVIVIMGKHALLLWRSCEIYVFLLHIDTNKVSSFFPIHLWRYVDLLHPLFGMPLFDRQYR